MVTFDVRPFEDNASRRGTGAGGERSLPAADTYWMPGMMPLDPWREPDVANAFVLVREGTAYLIDSGVGPSSRAALRAFFAAHRFESVTLVNTHLHADHVGNNDLLCEVDVPHRRHLIHPAGAPWVDTVNWMRGEARAAAREYSPFLFDTFPLNVIGRVAQLAERAAPEAAFALYARVALRKFRPLGSRTPYVAALRPGGRRALRVGRSEFAGWSDGPLLLLDDGGHSPDSLAVYDPRERILLVGDLTYEYNPVWPSGTYGRMLERLGAYRALAQAGDVAVFGDGHHHRLFHGADEIVPLLDGLIEMHERRRAAIVAAAERLGRRGAPISVEAVRRALVVEDPEFAALARHREYPRALCFTRAMIAVALREACEVGAPHG